MELTENCKRAIAENRCLGCTALEDNNFRGNPNCRYSKLPTAKDSLKIIKENIQLEVTLDVLKLKIEVIIKNIIKLLKILVKNIKMMDKEEYGKIKKNQEKK